MRKLDEIEARLEKEKGVFVPLVSVDKIELLFRAVRQYGRERQAYQALWEAVDNDHKLIQVHAPEVYDAYDVITATPEPESDVLELLDE